MEEAARSGNGPDTRAAAGGFPAMRSPHATRSILITSAWFGALVAVAIWAYLGFPWFLGFVGGALIGAANLVFLTVLAREILTLEKKKRLRIAAVLAIKVVMVYGGLALLLVWDLPPTLAVVVGFALVLVVITLKAAGRALLASGVFGAQSVKGSNANRRGKA